MTLAMNDTLTPPPGPIDTRLPGTTVNLENGNQNELWTDGDGASRRSHLEMQHIAGKAVTEDDHTPGKGGELVAEVGAGYHAVANPGNHTQVVARQDVAIEIQLLLGQLGVNHGSAGASPSQAHVGRKNVFDDFLRGRLVSLLAMGFSLRQAGAALGVSHVAISKELKRNPELTEQVTAARFQAQIEPLLVILRESKRSWRAATWVVNYLQKQLREREETREEAFQRNLEENEARRIHQEESDLAAEQRRNEREWDEIHRSYGIKVRKRKKKT
jgi:hypothetical protein